MLDIDDKLKTLNKYVTWIKAKHALDENEWNELLGKFKLLSAKDCIFLK